VTNGRKSRAANCFGECRDCGRVHSLGAGNALKHARELIAEFEAIGRLDYRAPAAQADPRLAFNHLFPGRRGHMFGVLECRDPNGATVVLRAFSSLHDGIRTIDGWVPSILSDSDHDNIVLPGLNEIKRMTWELEMKDPESVARRELLHRRRDYSRALMKRVHELYHLTNFQGETRPLAKAWNRDTGMPGGVGDCCGPKLLNHAAKSGLRPVGLAEFYWGGPHPAGRKSTGGFYPCCEEKCQPILGFLLCGLEAT
jgi:hypothetical protein